ncbi:paraquat-inducible protein A [Symmachiella dynata]|uniref:paraquat-inducible protein A n=1 Tax=Symmachiella dynata TaxID=2527995 RepID=UPI0030EDDD18
MNSYRACHCCGMIHSLPDLVAGQVAACTRCRATICRAGNERRSAQRTAAAALGAFVLFWPAIFLPILEIEKLGHHHESSLIGGIIELFAHGNFFVGGIVLLFSVIFPLTKIVMLVELSLLELLQRKHKAVTYRIMETAGKWSMMDVLLLAFLVMLVKLGSLVEFHFGPAVFAFVACVAMSMLASLSFDPYEIWEVSDE